MFKSYKEYLKNIVSNDDKLIESIDVNVYDKHDFYTWLLNENTNMSSYINEASKIIDLFDISSYDNLELYDNIKIMNGPVDRKRLIQVMEKENFVFIN